jgi:hypothetical protein
MEGMRKKEEPRAGPEVAGKIAWNENQEGIEYGWFRDRGATKR